MLWVTRYLNDSGGHNAYRTGKRKQRKKLREHYNDTSPGPRAFGGSAPAWNSHANDTPGMSRQKDGPPPHAWLQDRQPHQPSPNWARTLAAADALHKRHHPGGGAEVPHHPPWHTCNDERRRFHEPHEHRHSQDDRQPRGSSPPQKFLKRKAGIFQRGTAATPKTRGTCSSTTVLHL